MTNLDSQFIHPHCRCQGDAPADGGPAATGTPSAPGTRYNGGGTLTPGLAYVVAVPVEGTWLVRDGVPVRVHTTRKEADFLLDRCEPGDGCDA